jgi:single-stranded DNA-binding protein
MFDVLLSGKLRGTPDVRTSRNGNPFATFRLSVPTGKDGGYVQASCICFSQTAIDVMVNLTEGDSVAVTGEAALKTWEGKNGTQAGLDVTVHNAMTAYQVKKKRATATSAEPSAEPSQHGSSPERPRFSHPDFQRPDMNAPMPDGWDRLDGL